jgi:hypothetical protein
MAACVLNVCDDEKKSQVGSKGGIYSLFIDLLVLEMNVKHPQAKAPGLGEDGLGRRRCISHPAPVRLMMPRRSCASSTFPFRMELASTHLI